MFPIGGRDFVGTNWTELAAPPGRFSPLPSFEESELYLWGPSVASAIWPEAKNPTRPTPAEP